MYVRKGRYQPYNIFLYVRYVKRKERKKRRKISSWWNIASLNFNLVRAKIHWRDLRRRHVNYGLPFSNFIDSDRNQKSFQLFFLEGGLRPSTVENNKTKVHTNCTTIQFQQSVLQYSNLCFPSLLITLVFNSFRQLNE